jgi:hypothetical protein
MHAVDSVIEASLVQPRPYQRRIAGKADLMFRGEYVHEQTGEHEASAQSIMIESPTGSGKTIMAMLTCATLQQAWPDLHIGWVAMRRNLLGQAAKENRDKRIGVQNIHYVSMFDKEPTELVRAKRQGRPVLMVVDEAQHDAANSMTHLHNLIEPQFILGMSATHFRIDKMKLCFQKVIKDAGIHQLIQEGYLSPYHHYTVPRWEAEQLADVYCSDKDRWGKSAFYFKNLSECRQFARQMESRGVPFELVTGSTNRDLQIERMEHPLGATYTSRVKGHTTTQNTGCDVLINCMVLTEGWDMPELKTAWVRDSGKGCTMQMGGRVFRQHKSLPFKQIVQSKLSKWPFMRTAIPQQSFVWMEDEWRSLTVNPKLNDINQNARIAIATTDVTMPDFITQRKARRSASTWRG